jgi:hypothetical protein
VKRLPKTLGVLSEDVPDRIRELWRIADHDIAANIVTVNDRSYFGAGHDFGRTVYTRDISLSGILGLNRHYPELMDNSLRFTRQVRLTLGLLGCEAEVPELEIPGWRRDCPDEKSFMRKYATNGYQRRTDDVVWLWAIDDLYQHHPELADWFWVYETGERCFKELYESFFDPADGLFFGQSCFVDIGSAYPDGYPPNRCMAVKATSTNALYFKGMQVMASAAARCDEPEQAIRWEQRAQALRTAIKTELCNPDGSFTYLKRLDGGLEPRRHVLADAFVVLCRVITDDGARRAVAKYPRTPYGLPLIDPFYPRPESRYHNNSIWPFADEFYLWAVEEATGEQTALESLRLINWSTTEGGKTFRELIDAETHEIRGSRQQLWAAAAFIHACRRAGYL